MPVNSSECYLRKNSLYLRKIVLIEELRKQPKGKRNDLETFNFLVF
jgi:hypothetical protein